MAKEAPKKVRGVYEHPDGSGVWWVNFYADGKRHREKVGRRSAAIDLYQKRKTEAREGVKLPTSMRAAKAVLFADLANDAMEYSAAHKRSHRGDLSNLASLLPVFGKMKAEDITPGQIFEYLASRSDLKPATLNRYRSTMSMIFQEGIRNGRVKSNPARLVRLRKENNARIRFLTYDEEETIRSVIRRRCVVHESSFNVAIETGMRLSEQHSLTWGAIDFERRQIELSRTKNGSIRTVVLNDRAIEALKECQSRSKPIEAFKESKTKKTIKTDRVFLSRYGEPLDNPKAWFKLVMADAVKVNPKLSDVTWHVFRHTFISRMVMAGVDLRTVQELAGHKDISMTIRYSHLSPDHKRSAIDQLAAHRQANAQATSTLS